MIYTFGCSVTKWYWPTWADWLSVYKGPVTNLAYKGYGNDNIYYTLLDTIDKIKTSDQVMIMWTQNHRFNYWYDQQYVEQHDIKKFFPKTDGELWYSNKPYTGMYRTHPNYMPSLTHMMFDEFRTIYNTQLLLEQHGCDYKMMFVHNPFLDCRPIYSPTFKMTWTKKEIISEKELEVAKEAVALKPFNNLLKRINWENFASAPTDPFDPLTYTGMWEYFFNKKEYLIYAHDTDPHPATLVYHDFALDKILGWEFRDSPHRQIAKDMSYESLSMPMPEFTQQDFIGKPETLLLRKNLNNKLNELRRY